MSKVIPVVLFALTFTLWGLSAAGALPGHCAAVANSAGAACLVLGGVSRMLTALLRDPYTHDRVVRRLADAVTVGRRTPSQRGAAKTATEPLRLVR